MKFWKTSAKLTFTWQTCPWFEVQGCGKHKQTRNVMGSPTVFPFVWGWLGVEGRIFPPVFSFSSSTESFVILTKATIISTSKCIYKYSLRWSNWHETQTALWVPGFSSFHPSTFQMTTGRITRNSSKFLALEVPMIPAGMQKKKKKGCFFFPLKIMYFPGTVQMPQMRQMRGLFWPTNEKTSPFSARALI